MEVSQVDIDGGLSEVAENESLGYNDFPGRLYAERVDVPEKSRRALGIIGWIKKDEHKKARRGAKEGEVDFYHGESEHIDVVMEAGIGAGTTLKYLSDVGRVVVSMVGSRFVNRMSAMALNMEVGPIKQSLVVDQEYVHKEENHIFTDDSLILLEVALAFHDIGRFTIPSGKTVDGKSRWTVGHEYRSINRLDEIFHSDEYRAQVDQLGKVYPELFGAEKIEESLKKIKYLIYWTKYIRKPGEDDKYYEGLFGPEPEETEERDKYLAERVHLNELGALTLQLDIGAMQIKSRAIHSMVGLVREYLADIEEKKDVLIFCSVEEWVLKWTTELTLPLSENVFELLKARGYMPSFMDEGGRITEVDPNMLVGSLIHGPKAVDVPGAEHIQAAVDVRVRLVEFIRAKGIVVTERITWGELHDLVEEFWKTEMIPSA